MSVTPVVYLVDDDAPFLDAQARMLRAMGLPVREFVSAKALLTQVSPECRGCLVTDLSMPEMNGLELQAVLAEKGAMLPIVFLTGHGDIPSSVQAIQRGALDFLEKNAASEDLVATILRALSSDAARHEARVRSAELRRRFSRLTPREREVLHLVVQGEMNKQIAARLRIHERTVKLHRKAIVAKIGVRSAAQLATMVHEARVFELDMPGVQRIPKIMPSEEAARALSPR